MAAPGSRDPAPGAFDILSAVLSLGAILPFVYGIKLIAEHGVGVSALLAIVFGVVFGVAFVARQRGLVDPLIDLGLFSFASFRVGITATFTACVAMAFVLFALTQYLQLVIGLSPVAAGLHLVPALLAALVATALARRAGRRVRAGTLVALGLACSAVGFVMLVWLGVGSGALLGSLAYVPISVGLNITLALGVGAIMSRAPRAGAGSAISETANSSVSRSAPASSVPCSPPSTVVACSSTPPSTRRWRARERSAGGRRHRSQRRPARRRRGDAPARRSSTA